MYHQTAGKTLSSQALSSPYLITGSHSRSVTQHTLTGKTVQAEIYTQQDGRMLRSFQVGRKEKPLAVRKEAHFSKALLSLEKGKQAKKSSPHYTVVVT